ncbi:hypothetical protein CKM354_000877000 [Cercospora kikuchii]|uniref:BTB domain-containing protein n=1 Tax=Cercospora kikuchii TaxID=84275 RepID=A0A9P3CMZ6_9PEZI|nr:uncharacterized protein CKM354_000877000 [Cercospora kikuchii]GIZ45611.1 hypothetical protein CKM354_000877000 [Cercospora kikuchii]
MANSIGPDEVPDAYKPLISNVQQLFASGEYSDLKITCEGKIWNVHRNIVCPACPFFETCCRDFEEARIGVINLPYDPKYAVEALISYIYTADYTTDDWLRSEKMLFQIRVHTIADKYGLPALSALAEAKFAAIAKDNWASGAFATALEEMYSVAPETKEGLQKVAIKIAVEHADVLLKDEKSPFARLSRRMQSVAYDLSKELSVQKAKKREEETKRKQEETKRKQEETKKKQEETKHGSAKKAASGPRCFRCGSPKLYRQRASMFQEAGVWCQSCRSRLS